MLRRGARKWGMRDDSACTAVIIKRRDVFGSFRTHDAETIALAVVERGAGDAPGWGAGCGDFERQCGGFGRECELREAAMHCAAGANAFDDLLAEVAALGEVQRASLAGLLWQIALAEVDAIARGAFQHAQSFRGADTARDGPGGEQNIPQHADAFVGAPQLEAWHGGGVATGELDGHAADARLHEPEIV